MSTGSSPSLVRARVQPAPDLLFQLTQYKILSCLKDFSRQSQLHKALPDGPGLMHCGDSTALCCQSRAWPLRALSSVQVSLLEVLCRLWPAC